MFKVIKEKEYISVTVKLQKRRLAKDPKIYYYYRDALLELRKVYPDIKINEVPENTIVISTVKAPHEGTWKFRILENKQDEKTNLTKNVKKLSKKQQLEALDELVELSQEMGGYDKELVADLTSDVESDIVEETVEKVQEPTE